VTVDLPGRRRLVAGRRVIALRPGRHLELPDEVVTEEPMAIRLAGPGQDPASVGVTMRTPGHDFELAVGFLASEGLIGRDDHVETVRYCERVADDEQRYNVVTVRIDRPVDVSARARQLPISSACGVCGTGSVDDLASRCRPVASDLRITSSLLLSLPERLRAGQRVFDRTGGLHAAGLFDGAGALLEEREDVGRHNAVDKLVGWAVLRGGLPLSSHVLAVSGRVGFEIVQKAAVAGIPVVAAVSAPSSLAVETAERLGITLAGFLRGDRGNVYTAPHRVDLDG